MRCASLYFMATESRRRISLSQRHKGTKKSQGLVFLPSIASAAEGLHPIDRPFRQAQGPELVEGLRAVSAVERLIKGGKPRSKAVLCAFVSSW